MITKQSEINQQMVDVLTTQGKSMSLLLENQSGLMDIITKQQREINELKYRIDLLGKILLEISE